MGHANGSRRLIHRLANLSRHFHSMRNFTKWPEWGITHTYSLSERHYALYSVGRSWPAYKM